MSTTHTLTLRTNRPAPGQLELLPGCGDRGTCVATVAFRVEPAQGDGDPYAEVIVTGHLGASSAPPPDGFFVPESEDPEISYLFEEKDFLLEARAYWRQLLSLGFRPE
jgi:hypothetical protein